MALEECPDCGKQISSTAYKCPHCGRSKSAAAMGRGIKKFAYILKKGWEKSKKGWEKAVQVGVLKLFGISWLLYILLWAVQYFGRFIMWDKFQISSSYLFPLVLLLACIFVFFFWLTIAVSLYKIYKLFTTD